MNDQDHQDSDLVGAYVLDALGPEETELFEAHLEQCADCRREVAELRRVVGVLPLAIDMVEPPPGLKNRVIEAAMRDSTMRVIPGGDDLGQAKGSRAQPRSLVRFHPWQAAVGLAAAVVIAALGIWNVQLQHQVQDKNSALAYQRDVVAALASGATVTHVPGTDAAPAARAALVQPSRGHAYVIVQGLPENQSDKVYQLWLVRGTTPHSAAVFTYAGNDPQIIHLSASTAGYAVAAVTMEPRPGSRAPTGRQLLLGKLFA